MGTQERSAVQRKPKRPQVKVRVPTIGVGCLEGLHELRMKLLARLRSRRKKTALERPWYLAASFTVFFTCGLTNPSRENAK